MQTSKKHITITMRVPIDNQDSFYCIPDNADPTWDWTFFSDGGCFISCYVDEGGVIPHIVDNFNVSDIAELLGEYEAGLYDKCDTSFFHDYPVTVRPPTQPPTDPPTSPPTEPPVPPMCLPECVVNRDAVEADVMSGGRAAVERGTGYTWELLYPPPPPPGCLRVTTSAEG